MYTVHRFINLLPLMFLKGFIEVSQGVLLVFIVFDHDVVV